MKIQTWLKQYGLIILGSLVVISAIFNVLVGFDIVNFEDAFSKSNGEFYPTPTVEQIPDGYVVSKIKTTPETLPTLFPTNTEIPNKPTAIIPTTESGFVPIQIEAQIDDPAMLEEDLEKEYFVPERLIIPAIDLDAPIVFADKEEIKKDGVVYTQWSAPRGFAVGWHEDTAKLGQLGNLVLNGHHNVHGEVFKNLERIQVGDRLSIYGETSDRYGYIVTNVLILEERDLSVEERLENARWIMPSDDERVTLVTCWPAYSNTHRLIVVAKPLETDGFLKYQGEE